MDAVNYLALDQPVRQQSQCPTGPAFRRLSAGQRNQVGFRRAVQFLWPAALLLPAPQGRFDPFLHAAAAYPFHRRAGDLEGPGNLFVRHASVFPRFIAQQQDARVGLLVRCPLETRAFSSCCSSVVSLIRYFLSGTALLLGYNPPMPVEYTSCTSIQ